jgi:hypothetical protein
VARIRDTRREGSRPYALDWLRKRKEEAAVGKFSTYKRWTLDDQTGPHETGSTLSPKQFLDELKEKYVEPARKYMRDDPMIGVLADENVTDEQYFKLLAQRWNFERSVGAIHATWLLSYTLGLHGELQEVENMEVR